MLFHSTRGKDTNKTFEDVLMQGLASDGGLFMPNEWPKVDLKVLKESESFIDVAKHIVPLYTKSSFRDDEVIRLQNIFILQMYDILDLVELILSSYFKNIIHITF